MAGISANDRLAGYTIGSATQAAWRKKNGQTQAAEGRKCLVTKIARAIFVTRYPLAPSYIHIMWCILWFDILFQA